METLPQQKTLKTTKTLNKSRRFIMLRTHVDFSPVSQNKQVIFYSS